MTPTVNEVLLLAAQHLGDPEQERFTPTKLLPWLHVATRELFDRMAEHGLPRVKRTVYHVLPAYTNSLTPAQVGITDFGELIEEGLSQCAISLKWALTGVAAGPPAVVQATGNSLVSNQEVVVTYDYPYAGLWWVTVSGSNITLNGSPAPGSVTYTGSYIVLPADGFSPVIPVEEVTNRYVPNAALGGFDWREGRWRFYPATTERLLRLEFYSSGPEFAQGATIPVDNSKDVLAFYTAYFAANDADMTDQAAVCHGGAQSKLANFIARTQRVQPPIRRPAFRRRRWNRY